MSALFPKGLPLPIDRSPSWEVALMINSVNCKSMRAVPLWSSFSHNLPSKCPTMCYVDTYWESQCELNGWFQTWIRSLAFLASLLFPGMISCKLSHLLVSYWPRPPWRKGTINSLVTFSWEDITISKLQMKHQTELTGMTSLCLALTGGGYIVMAQIKCTPFYYVAATFLRIYFWGFNRDVSPRRCSLQHFL